MTQSADKSPRVLLADDEDGLRELVRTYLAKAGMEVLEARNGQEAEDIFRTQNLDLAILDIMMPEVDGLSLCHQVREEDEYLPILLLTARGEEIDRLVGFEMGADDYVVKPFSPRELVARAKAILRRSRHHTVTGSNQDYLKFPNLVIDTNLYRVEWQGQEVKLTPTEFNLLYLLAQNPRRVFSRKQVMAQTNSENYFGDYFGDSHTVDVHVKNLREKFNAIAPFSYIRTVWGVGYKFEV